MGRFDKLKLKQKFDFHQWKNKLKKLASNKGMFYFSYISLELLYYDKYSPKDALKIIIREQSERSIY